MNCERYQNWAALAASGDLTVTERRSLEEHVQTCGECRLCVAEFAALSAGLAELRDPEIDPAVYASIRRNVRNRLPEARPRVVPLWLAWPAAAAAVAVALIVLRDIEGLDTHEVARILAISEATVRSHICSARSKLKKFVNRATGKQQEAGHEL